MSLSLSPNHPHSPLGAATPQGPILVLDSGLGGLTVAAALRRRLPHEQAIYVGDTARVPYGSKSPEAIRNAVVQAVAAVLRTLEENRSLQPKHLIVACNSASAVALPTLREAFPGLSVSGVIEPGARAAAKAAGGRVRATIGVIATEATIRSRAYETAIGRRRPRAHVIFKPTPLLVPLVEEGRSLDDPVLRLALEQYLRPVVRRAEQLNRRLDALVLGCTHYPLLMEPIRETIGHEVAVIDSAEACADDVASRLTSAGLLRPSGAPGGEIRIFATDVPERFGRLASRFLGEPVDPPELLTVDDQRPHSLRRTA